MADHDTHDHTGIPGISSGSVATDTIWDAAGDLAVGSGANTAARLAIGATNGMAVQRVSGAVAWALPPGYEFDYAEFTSIVNVTQTAEASANTLVTGNAVTYDGSTIVRIEVFLPFVAPVAGDNFRVYLFDGGSSIGQLGIITAPAATTRMPMMMARRLTPSAASHTYSARAVTGSGTAAVSPGAGGSGNAMPGYIRITKV